MAWTLSHLQPVSVRTRRSSVTKVCEYLGYLGIALDEEQNNKRGEDLVISTPDSKVKVCIIPTNEELAIARETVAL